MSEDMRKGIADPTPNAEGGNVSFCEDTMNEMYLFHRLFNETMSGSGDDPMSNKLRKICRQHTHTYNFTTGDIRQKRIAGGGIIRSPWGTVGSQTRTIAPSPPADVRD